MSPDGGKKLARAMEGVPVRAHRHAPDRVPKGASGSLDDAFPQHATRAYKQANNELRAQVATLGLELKQANQRLSESRQLAASITKDRDRYALCHLLACCSSL